ncbi:MAG: GntR family transcriptional regulator [Christensenellaceae bacterium]|nr:GntR family transcriptional regulator [Christensenellaceae bacterium]
MRKNESLKFKVYKDLKNRILKNEIKQGEYLEEKAICEEYGVSRTPVREAMVLLEKDDLIKNYPNKGIFVTEISIQATKELFQIRRYLEPIAFRLAFDNLNLNILTDFKEELMQALDNKDYMELHELDYRIHNYINSKCNNIYLLKYLNNVSDTFQRIRTQPFYAEKRTEGGAKEHIVLINLIIERKLNEALELLNEHITNTETYYFNSLIN